MPRSSEDAHGLIDFYPADHGLLSVVLSPQREAETSSHHQRAAPLIPEQSGGQTAGLTQDQNILPTNSSAR
ncbi:unnamed protein product [Pleuronectes platessa]|uniref:Uncharacterized protein n=1 Tax=Pleuronectes platessa TaxID=8262 RepID=A0A9N7UYN8_PLEPL|nr:unnamed protein product [Pleuronectes platessa]